MTTPSGAISMQDIRNETGATGAVSFNDWFVRHVAKTATGAVSMSSMRGKTCYPAKSTFGSNYVNSELYIRGVVNDTWWKRSLNTITIYQYGFAAWDGYDLNAATNGYLDAANGNRYFKGSLKETGTNIEYHAIRWVHG
jgi:hypothetical protein